MDIAETRIADVKLVTPQRHADHRGSFAETYNARDFARAGIGDVFIMDSRSVSTSPYTVRGLHFQLPPHAQGKLVQVIRGSVFDVAVDLRRDSPTFGQHVSARLTAAEGTQLFVPVGFAHGFCTLEPDTEVLYKIAGDYAPAHGRGLLWNDPDLAIPWPVAEGDTILSQADATNPRLVDLRATLPTDWNTPG